MPCVAHLMLVMLRLTPFVAHLMLVMVLNLPEQCSFQDMLFHLLFMPKSAEKSASRMDISLQNTDLRNCSRLSKHCTKPALEDEMRDVPKEDQIEPASLWSGLADGIVSCDDCYPMMGFPAPFSNFKLGG